MPICLLRPDQLTSRLYHYRFTSVMEDPRLHSLPVLVAVLKMGTHCRERPGQLTPTCPILGILTPSLKTSPLSALPLASQLTYKELPHLQQSLKSITVSRTQDAKSISGQLQLHASYEQGQASTLVQDSLTVGRHGLLD